MLKNVVLVCLGLILWSPLTSISRANNASALPVVSVPKDSAKFDVILLVGQSNMAGRGKVEDSDRQPDPRILTLNADDEWVNQGQPIHFDKAAAGTGLGFTFARMVAAQNPESMIGLIPCAVGGTAIEAWLPGKALYENALRRAKIAMKDGTLKAILWHQGEQNAYKKEQDTHYAERLKIVLEAFRKDLGAPDVPILLGELGEFVRTRKNGEPTHSSYINEQIHRVAEEIPRSAVIPAEGLKDKGDCLHFDAEALREFGARYFKAWHELSAQAAAKSQ